jgi:hypothetical protein
MMRAEARRLLGHEVPGMEDNGPDPTEDPILYLEEGRDEPEEREK